MDTKKNTGGPIRILQYIGSLETGGSQSMIMNIYRNIDRNRIQFDFVVDRKGEGDLFYKDEIESLGGKVYIFDEYFKGYNYFGFTKQWKDFFREHPEYEIIHCHVRSVASIVLKIAKRNGLKTICHSHSISNGRGFKAIAKKLLQKGIGKNSDYLLACSKEAAVWLYGEEGAISKKCVIINNAIWPDRYRFNSKMRTAIRKKYGIKDDEILVGHVGRFVDVKNHMFMLELADALKNKKIKFVFCGDGELKKDVVAMTRKKKAVLFYDEYDKANELYNAMDAFILPSKYEGLGIVLIEAQFNGLPCIVSSAVPCEAKISKTIEFLPLDIELWASAVSNLSVRSSGRSNLLSCSEKYVVSNEIVKLVRVYSKLARNKNER